MKKGIDDTYLDSDSSIFARKMKRNENWMGFFNSEIAVAIS